MATSNGASSTSSKVATFIPMRSTDETCHADLCALLSAGAGMVKDGEPGTQE